MILQTLKKSAAYTLVIGTVLSSAFPFIEPMFVTAQTTAIDQVVVTLTVDTGITITTASDVTMAPNIGVASNSSIGSTTWNVKTNDPQGYTLAVHASTSPALRLNATTTFADYTPATPGVPDVWAVPASSIEFGYSAFGSSTPTGTWGTGSSCGSAGTPTGTLKFNGFATSTFTVSTHNATTTTAGVPTTLCFAAEQDGVYAAAGTYTANITATATVQ